MVQAEAKAPVLLLVAAWHESQDVFPTGTWIDEDSTTTPT
jgi:hypothetical protein